MNATDPRDSGLVEYSIVAGALGRFAIDPVSGLISTTSMLDREEQDSYVLTVQARDAGTVPRSSIVQVHWWVCSVGVV